MQIFINDQATDIGHGATLQTAVEAMGFNGQGVAAAIDEQVIPRGQWSDVPLREGSRVVVLQATQGG